MDLIVSIILLTVISVYKVFTNKSASTIVSTVRNDEGAIEVVNVVESNLVVGKNLMLRKEPRAYHRILDEMGLS